MEHCPFSLISPKNVLHEALLKDYSSAWCGRQLKISGSISVPVCPGWPCFWGILTGHSSSLTPASHRAAGSLQDTLTSGPGPHSGSLPSTEPPNPSSPSFSYAECEVSLVEHAFSSRNILTFHIQKTIKNPLNSHLLQLELVARASSSILSFHYMCNGCAFSIMTLYCFRN